MSRSGDRGAPPGRPEAGGGGRAISVFGLGYVGTVTAVCLTRLGHRVVGVDVNPAKVDLIRQGISPVVEPGLAELLRDAVARGRLTATGDAAKAVAASRVSLLCVGTPGGASGEPDYRALFHVCRQIGAALRGRRPRHLIVIRSTCVPGTLARAARVVERSSGKRAGRDVGLCVNPEFLREGTAIADFGSPPYTVVGSDSPQDAAAMREIYSGVEAEFIEVAPAVAEMIKFANNSFHAVKITFANEIGAICGRYGIDSHEVMDLLCRDTKLNVSRAYLRPGFAFGGSCLPKDLRAIAQAARSSGLDVPLLGSALVSNDSQITALVDRIAARRGARVGIAGLAFKSGTDDLRESPMVRVVETLLGKGFSVDLFDPNVSLSRLMGANKAYIEREIPHLSRLLRPDLETVIRGCDVLVIANRDGVTPGALAGLKRRHRVIDLIRVVPREIRSRVRYEGLYW